MLKKLIESLFPQGQRKVIVSLIVVLIGAILEKWGGGLSESMLTALIAVAAIFTGGNVLEHLAQVLAPLKGTKIGQVIEDIIPGDQGLKVDPKAPQEIELDVAEEEEPAWSQALKAHVTRLESQIKIQANNTAQIVHIINAMTNGAPPIPAQARPPQPPPPQERL